MNRLCVMLLSVIFYYYPSLLTTILSLFACYSIDPATPGNDELYPEYAQVRTPGLGTNVASVSQAQVSMCSAPRQASMFAPQLALS